MKRLVYILVALLISLTISVVGNGISLIVCTHSHTVQLASDRNVPLNSNSNDETTWATELGKGCMNEVSVDISPTEITHSVSIDDVCQTADNEIIVDLFAKQIEKINPEFGNNRFETPPRNYLKKLGILII